MNTYLIIILAVLIISACIHLVSELLNLGHIQTALPEAFKGYYDAEKYKKSQQYLRENTRFTILTDTVMTVITIAFILAGGFNSVDRIARGLGLGAIATGLVFIGILLLASHLLHLPFSAYTTFVIEEKYGFNKTTVKTFILDIVKTWGLAAVIGGILCGVVLWFFGTAGPWAWLYCWLAVTLIQIFLALVAPVVILPLFNKFTPLPEGALKKALTDYTQAQHFKIKGIYTMDGSRRSLKSNAFFTGLGRFRRIALFDTLLDKHTPDELVCIVAHEVGHYKKNHVIKNMLIAVLTSGVMFSILSIFLNNRALFAAFRMEHLSVYASLVFFGFLFVPIDMILSVLSKAISRRYECEADAFAVTTSGKPASMITALKKLSVDNLANISPHPLKVLLTYSHPPVLERIQKIATHGG